MACLAGASSLLGDLSDYSLYCRANNLLLSPVLDQQIQAAEFLRRVLDETNSDCFWSEGVLKIKPFGDASATANGVTWNPDLTPIYDLSDDDFEDEPTIEMIDQSTLTITLRPNSWIVRTNIMRRRRRLMISTTS
jgi:hypothetical protein